MNIAEAKQQIKNAMLAYFSKDEYGRFEIPPEMQRPVFLMGPPGIGKTAIISQIAEELGVNLVSYSMTHHTRQSALGLPVIVRKSYEGKEYSVSEYTMSEIIATVYDTMEASGIREGILFLDEINCVSETLIPTMLQFLQFKMFGRHRLPDGWIVVTAGNPPEYNRSAREFDIVIRDRLKHIDIEPDYTAWKSYAVKKGIHPAVISYLDVRKDNFYRIEAAADGVNFVTVRGWTDLSDMIKLYEKNAINVDMLLVRQYIANETIARDFAEYYDLFDKYRSDYRIPAILAGNAGEDILRRAAEAPFDERLSLISLLLDSVGRKVRDVIEREDIITTLQGVLKQVKNGAPLPDKTEELEKRFEREYRMNILSPERRRHNDAVLAFLKDRQRTDSDFDAIKAEYGKLVSAMRSIAEETGSELEQLFAFAEKVWPNGQELLIILAEMTSDLRFGRFLSRYGCEAYYRHCEKLMFRERQIDMIGEINRLEAEL